VLGLFAENAHVGIKIRRENTIVADHPTTLFRQIL
jgi:hypothetical protein